jgi:iron complex outermembrane recepter protein
MKSKSLRIRLMATTVVAVAALSSGSAYAQAAAADAADATAEDAGEIIVTGSRIARPDLEASSPVTVVSAESLRLSGTTNTEEFLRDLPQAVAAIGQNSNNGNPGVATLDLRNLGESRTLILVDGKRFVPYDSNGFVDLNMIPASLIERAEVLTGGASSVYGSDAVAGVVNFVLKKDFSGFEADAQYGLTQKGDGASRAFSATVGVNSGDGRGNLVANATFIKVDSVNQGQRGYSANTLAAADLSASGGSSTNPSGAIDGLLGTTGRGIFDASGNIIKYVGARDAFNFNPFNLLQVPQKKWTATVLGRYDLTDDVEFFGRFSFANSRVSTIIAPSGTFGFPYSINYATNPFLNAQARGILAQNDTVAAGDTTPGDGFVTVPFRRRTVELGTRDSIYENTAYQAVGGLRGNITDTIKWETFAQYGRTARTITFANDIANDKVQQALLAVAGPNGTVVCSDPSGGCAPANLFGRGNLSQAAGNFIRVDLQQYDTTSQLVTGGFISADLPFKLASDKAGGIVFGVEYRREGTRARPDNNLITGNSVGFGSSTPISARLATKEVYGEVNIPIVTDKPFFESLSLEAGIRYADYKNLDKLQGIGNSFKTTSYKIGAEWTPVASLKIRGGFNRAVRAPNLNDIGQPFTPGTGSANYDHCESISRGQPITLTPAVVANVNRGAAATQLLNLCLATGVPLTALQNGLVDGVVSGQINNYQGGNIRLTPEKADTLTVGAVFKPTFIRGFTASIDFFDIKIKNAIFNVPEQETLIGCYEVDKVATSANCRRIIRNPITGSLSGGIETGVRSTSINIGGQRTQGIDLAINYKYEITDDTSVSLAFNGTRTSKSSLDYVATKRECTGLVGQSCVRLLPKYQWVQSTTLATGPLTVQLRWQHIGQIAKDSVAFGLGGAVASDFAVPVIKSRNYFDLFSSVEVGEKVTFRAGINNLLNKQPPVVGNDYGGPASGNTFPATYDPLGRSFFAGVTARF